jgi:acetoin utilization protein AcuC
MREVVFLSSSDVWRFGHGPDHPLKPARLKRTHELLEELGAFDSSNVQLIAPRQATLDELGLFHSRKYLEIVRSINDGSGSLNLSRYGFGPGDNPVFEGMFESESRKVGSALQAAEMLVGGQCDIAFSYSGGLHHGGPDFASGFCVFNDAAVAISWLVEQDYRVAYVDIDVHHGDGVQNAFYDSDRVLTLSIHQDGRTLFPGTGTVEEIGIGPGEGYSVNVPLPPYTDDDMYLGAFREIVPQVVRRFEADVMVTQLGVDTHALDPLAHLRLSTRGQEELFRTLGDNAPLWLALGGGGYNLDVVPRAWAIAFGVMTGLDFPERLPANYRRNYGGRWLQDQANFHLNNMGGSAIQEHVSAVVRHVKLTHGLE